jgi:long-chain acyl-CoA synthetase
MLHETRPRVVFVGAAADLVRLRESWPKLESCNHIVAFETPEEGLESMGPVDAGCRLLAWQDALVRGRALMERGDGLRPTDSGRSPGDAATLIYSAGRTGPPRGSLLSHQGLVSKVYALRDVVVLPRSAVQFLALPLDSMFGRLLAWAAIDQGATTWLSTPRTPLGPQLAEARPHFLAGVPRTFEQLGSHILTRREGAVGVPGRTTLVMAERFLGAGVASKGRRSLLGLDLRLARSLFQTRVRHLLGGRVRHLVCGGGALDAGVERLFQFGGIPVLQGYGSNETIGAATANRPDDNRPGSVGRALSDVEIRVSPAGEVLFRGPGLFMGYLRSFTPGGGVEVDPARDPEGWFHSRDLGLMEEGYLYLTGRQQDILRLSSGRLVAASMIETALCALPFVKHAVLCGDNRPHLSALFWLSAGAGEHQLPGSRTEGGEGAAELEDPDALLRQALQRVNQSLERHEQIRVFRRVEDHLTSERGELSTNGEAVRSVIFQRYRDIIDSMYTER